MLSVSAVGVNLEAGPAARVQDWAATWQRADDLERRLAAATVSCIARSGLRKTTLDDIGREAGVSRATVYRVFPGGKGRLAEVVLHHEIGRFFHELDSDLAASETLEDLLVVAIGAALGVVADHAALRTLLVHEPEVVMVHFSFHRLDRVLATTTALCRPYLRRFLPAAALAPAADWLARVVLTYSAHPSPAMDPHDEASIRRLVHTYLVPGIRGLADPDTIARDPSATLSTTARSGTYATTSTEEQR